MNCELGEVIIVTGTPGTGKTTFSKALKKATGFEYVNLTQYVSKHKLYRGIDRERRTRIVDVAKTRAKLSKDLRKIQGYVIVDTHMPEGSVPEGAVHRVFVLRCHPKVLEARLRAKKWKPNKIRENVLAEIVDSCLTAAVKHYDSRKVIQLDTSRGGIGRKVVEAKRSLLRKPAKLTKIDWLTTLEKEGLLDRYLR